MPSNMLRLCNDEGASCPVCPPPGPALMPWHQQNGLKCPGGKSPGDTGPCSPEGQAVLWLLWGPIGNVTWGDRAPGQGSEEQGAGVETAEPGRSLSQGKLGFRSQPEGWGAGEVLQGGCEGLEREGQEGAGPSSSSSCLWSGDRIGTDVPQGHKEASGTLSRCLSQWGGGGGSVPAREAGQV